MCIDLFAFGQVITIPLLFEQIWVKPKYQSVSIEETYDVVVRNDDVSPIKEFWVFYPHDVTDSNRHDSPNAHILSIEPAASSQKENWYIRGAPKWIDESASLLEIRVPKDPFQIPRDTSQRQVPDVADYVSDALNCRRLTGEVRWPLAILDNLELVQVMALVKKSLFRLILTKSLDPGKTGIIRIRISPRVEQLSINTQIIPSPNPFGQYPFRFTWELRIDSPEVLREEARTAFKLASTLTNIEISARIAHVKMFLPRLCGFHRIRVQGLRATE